MAAIPLELNNWNVSIRTISHRRATTKFTTSDDTPIHDEPVVDVLPAANNNTSAVVAVAVSDITGQVLTATAKENGLSSYEILRFEYDNVLDFSSSDDDCHALYSKSIDQAFWNKQSSTVVGYGNGSEVSLWGTPLEVDGEAGQTGRVVVRRHGGLFLNTVTQLLGNIARSRGVDGVLHHNEQQGDVRLTCSFMAVTAHDMTDLLATNKTAPTLRTVANETCTDVTHLSEHSIDENGRASSLLSRAFEALDTNSLSTGKNTRLNSEKRKRALKTGPSSNFRRGSTILRAEILHPDLIIKLHLNHTKGLSRTTLTFVEMSSLNGASHAFLRCVANNTIHTPCRDSLLTLILKSTFISDCNNLFLGHLICDGSGGSSRNDNGDRSNGSSSNGNVMVM